MPPKKKPGTIVTLKNGARAKVLPSGRYSFISGPTKGRGAKKKAPKGGSAAVGGSVRRKRKKKGGSATVGGGLGVAKKYQDKFSAKDRSKVASFVNNKRVQSAAVKAGKKALKYVLY